MYNKLSADFKRRIFNYEDEPPEKKLISDGDIFIKQLAEKQRSTKITLEEELASKSQFYKSTELVSLTSYASGSSSLQDFNSIIKHSNDVEKLKSCELSNDDIELFIDYQNGKEHMKNKHRNINDAVLNERLKTIVEKINQHKPDEKETTNLGRHHTELIQSAKPNSIETKLLEFALKNKQKCKETLPGPMDQIKEVEKQLVHDLAPVNIKKIRKKARSLMKQIEEVSTSTIKEPDPKKISKSLGEHNFLNSLSKWDVKETNKSEDTYYVTKEKTLFTCKPQNYYTIKDGEIVKINSSDANKADTIHKLSLEEIKKIPKFKNYEKGAPSHILYLKNLAGGVAENDLECLTKDFSKEVVSIKVMKGRMQGQAFIEFTGEETAERVLNQCNGIILRNRPVIIQFGKRKT